MKNTILCGLIMLTIGITVCVINDLPFEIGVIISLFLGAVSYLGCRLANFLNKIEL